MSGASDSWGRDLARRERAHLLVSNSRLALAVAVAVLAWQAFVSHRLSAVWAVVPAVAFLGLVVVHAGVLRRISARGARGNSTQRGMSRLDSTWSGRGPDGARFLDGHPFAHDLDLFGPGSLFQLLDTARTEIGEETLAAWLGDGAGIQEVRARQRAIAELTPKVDFREDLAVLAAEADVGRTGPLAAWAPAPSAGLSRVHRSCWRRARWSPRHCASRDTRDMCGGRPCWPGCWCSPESWESGAAGSRPR